MQVKKKNVIMGNIFSIMVENCSRFSVGSRVLNLGGLAALEKPATAARIAVALQVVESTTQVAAHAVSAASLAVLRFVRIILEWLTIDVNRL